MKDIQQLIKKNSQEGRYEDIFPKTFIDAVEDRESGNTLTEILSGFNMYFLSYNGSRELTRLQVPLSLRKTGLWITYVLYDKTVVTEWYTGEAIDDDSWKNLSNWRVGTNMLVGDISISSDGYWVVNDVITTTKAQGEQGITPMLRVGSNNHLQVSYTNGSSWVDVSTNPVYTQFRINNNKLEQSVDLGQTWTIVSDYIASWFRFTGTTGSSQADNVGKIQISRDNGVTWSDLSGEFTNSLHIKGYVATVSALPSTAIQGDIYGVGPTYDSSDTEQTNPIYQLYVKDSTGWVNNGRFTSISAGIVQELGNSETEVISQKATTKAIHEILYDVSSHNDGEVFESLSTLLGSADLSTLIPASVRRGGMSIRFIQSSDNKYVQYRLMADEFTTNTTQWAIANEDVYVENPEFIYVKTDKDDKILWAIKTDGSIYYGTGVPQQVVDYINNRIAELSLDEYEDIVVFLNNLEKGDKTLQILLNEKVDKEKGKSLIDAEVASTKSSINSLEFLDVTFDAENKVLEGIQRDGTKVIGGDLSVGGDIKILGNMDFSGVSYKVVKNREFLVAWVDAKNKVIFALKADGKTYVGDADFLNEIKNNQEAINEIKSYLTNLDIDALSSIMAVENPEFIEATTDSEGKLLAGRTSDGEAFETIGFSTPKVSIDGHTIENIEDPEERSEITTDSEGKVISYRDSDGVKHEEVGLVLSKDGLSNFEKALIDSGFQDGGKNFSSIIAVELPEPKRYGLVNLLIDKLPVEDSELSSGYIEYYDFAGNYFKKSCEITSQGQSSKWFARTGGKGNYTLDITGDSEIKFGSWVPQDSFHLKGCAKDVTRGYLSTSYKFAWEIMNYLNAKPDGVLNKDSKITETSASGDRFTDWPSDARCLPDGFPIEIYINGEYWGLYALQLKKHRKNYSMKKSDYTSFFVDADNLTGFWVGNIPWTKFEIKNPKDLICMDGSEYDGDNPKELIDSTSEYYNPSNEKHVGSAQTKAIIQSWSVKYQEIKDLINVGTQESLVEAKDLFAEYFDVNACIFVYIFNCTMRNFDSITKNTLWGTWKNGKVAPMLYDLDAMYGESWIGNYAGEPSSVVWNDYANAVWPLSLLWSLYEEEIKDAYANLRRSGILSIDTWKTIIYSKWIKRIGTEAYERDIEKWPETPSYRKNYTDTDNWEELRTLESKGSYNIWDSSVSYNQGDNVVLNMGGPGYCVLYTAKQANINKCPVTKYYTEFPYVSGYFDSPKRMEKWMMSQISICDTFMDYLNN